MIVNTVISYLPIALSLYLLAVTFASWYHLRKFNGPLAAPFTNLWHFGGFWSGKLHLKYYEAIKDYGKI
jgi:hypothetical protein